MQGEGPVPAVAGQVLPPVFCRVARARALSRSGARYSPPLPFVLEKDVSPAAAAGRGPAPISNHNRPRPRGTAFRGDAMKILDADAWMAALMAAPRPGADKILAFYDARVDAVCRDARCLLLPLDDHMCHRGDALFESLCYREGRLFALEEHLARLRDGSRALSLLPPCSWDGLRARILDVARASGSDHGDIRVLVGRGPGGFGISPEECPRSSLYIVALRKELPTEAFYEKGLTAFASAIPPKQDYLARIKSTNYLPNVFMAAEARQRGMDVAVTFDEDGHLGEAAIANVGIVDAEGRLCCPEGRRILPGTSMLAARKIAPQRLPVVERPIRREEIFTAREMLLFTSASLCVGISHFEGRPIGQGPDAGRPGPVARWLRDALLEHMLATVRRLRREWGPLLCFDAGHCWCARGPSLNSHSSPQPMLSGRGCPLMVSDSQVEYDRRTSAIGFSVFPSPYGDRSGPAQTYVLMPVSCP